MNKSDSTQISLKTLLTKISRIAPVALHEIRQEPDGTIHMPHASPDIVDIYGLNPDEIAEDFSRVWALIHPDDRPRIERATAASATTLKPYSCEWRIRHPDKGEIWVECRSSPERQADGTVAWYGYFHDITERKRIEKALYESQRSLATLMDNLPGMAYRRRNDQDWTTEFISSGSYALTGYEPEAYTSGRVAFGDLVHTDDRDRVANEIQSAVAEQRHYQLEYRIPAADGHERWVWDQGCAVYDTEYQPVVLEGLVTDITARKAADAHLALLGFALDHVHDAVYLMDENSSFIYVNQEACRQLGYDYDELINMQIKDIDPLYPEEQWPKDWQAIQQSGAISLETQHKRKDGSVFPVEIRANFFAYGRYDYNLALARDISERKRVEEHLALLSFALNNVQEATYLIDQDSRFLYVNDEACRALGYDRDELLQMGVIDIDPDFPMSQWKEHWQDIREKGSVTLETSHQRKDGSTFPIEVSANYFEYDGQGYNLAIVRDITVRKQQEKQIQYLAYHDALTDLPNRLLIMDRLEHAIIQAHRRGDTLAVLFIDVDRFKTVNDTLGHQAGDTLLQQVGNRLVDTLRDADSVGRLGGDEFLILLPELLSIRDAAHVTEKVHEVLSVPFKVMGHDIHVTTSIGISIYPRDAHKAEALISYADAALYLAKEQGRNTFQFFSPELNAKVHDRLHKESSLRRAIEREELVLNFQPQLNLGTGMITGIEALVRWQHPEHGLIAPGEFIPIAEEIGLIVPIGEWVLRKATTQARAWELAGMPNVRICVNVSQRQLEHSEFVHTVQQILLETGCDPHLLELEITESGIMNQPEAAIEKLQALSDLGVQVALDDFGTGYSSLAYLKRLPLDRLKIDRSFVSGVPQDVNDVAIVQTVIVLARQLGLKVVAEGVETEDQRQFLKANGCDDMQGYLVGKPVPEEELAAVWKCGGDDRSAFAE